MIESPFSLFRQFSDTLHIVLFTKEDVRPHDVRETFHVKEEASAEQVHGIKTAIVRSAVERSPGADGLATDRTGLALAVRAADCQSFVVFAPAKSVIGILHAGWRGLLNGAILAFFETLQKEWGVRPEETFVGAGPSLCQDCAEFTDPLSELPAIDPRFFRGRFVDLRGAADAELLSIGVLPSRFERQSDCTACHPERYWTYRGGDRETVKNGERNLLACVLRER